MASSQYTAKFTADGSGYARNLNKMRDQTKKFSASVGSMLKGAFAFAGIAGIKRLMSEMDRIQKLSKRFGLAAEDIQRMGFAAEQGGSSLEVMVKGLANANRMAIEAGRGLKTYTNAFDDLGINYKEFAKLDQEKQFMVMADAVRYATDQNKAMAASQVIMGRAAMELRAMMLDGAEGYRKVTDGLKTMTQAQVDAAAKANDAMNKFLTNTKVLTVDFAGFLKKMVQGTRASLAQMAVEAEGSSFFEKFAGMFEGKTAEQEFRIKLAFEEGVYGQELEDMMRERAAKGLAGGLATIRGITSGLITAGQPTEEDTKVTNINDKIAAEKKKQAEAEMKDKEKLASLDDEIARGLEEYAVIAANEGKDSIKAKEKELELLELQTKQKALQRKIAADEKAKKDKADDKLAKTQEEIAAERKEREEMGMSDEEILARRKAELKQKEDALAGLGEDANGDGKIDSDDDQFKADKQLDIENLKTEIKNLEQGGGSQGLQASVITSQLASIGGGGATASFTNDPILSENKRQSNLLEQLVKLQGGTTEGGGNLFTPEL
jgi:hypothetical protein